MFHLFYTDDAIFIGVWKDSNIQNLIRVLHYFHLAFGLKMNLNKSKLLGICVNNSSIEVVATWIGYDIMKILFRYLGLAVGGNMNRLNSWREVMHKVTYKLSNSKVKTLSIGRRLTLIKSVLGTIPTFFMSIYKATKGILSKIEALRDNFWWGRRWMRKNYPFSIGKRL